MLPCNSILCPLDFSESSLSALDTAVSLAENFGASLVVLHVIAPILAAGDTYGLAYPDLDAVEEERKTECLGRMRSLVEERQTLDLRVQYDLRVGDAAEEIVEAAKMDIDLLVICTHGLTGWRHLVFGSTAEHVVRLAPCPVLTVRAKSEKVKIADAAEQRQQSEAGRDGLFIAP